MKKNNYIWLVLAILILAGLAWFSYSNNSKSTLNAADSKFNVLDTAAITKVFLAHKDGRKNTLTRKGGLWLINNTIIADGALIRLMMKAIHDVDVKRPVTANEKTEVVRSIATKHIKVELYAGENLIKTYYVGNEFDNYSGTLLLMEGSEQPYVGFLPGFEGVLTQRFDVRPEEWRDKHIFKTNPSILESVKVSYPNEPGLSFDLSFANGKFKISNIPDADTLKAERFLQELTKASVDSWVNPDMVTHDSLLKVKPMLEIALTNKGGLYNETLVIWDAPKNPDRYPAYLKILRKFATVQKFQVAHFAPKKTDLVEVQKSK